MYILCLIVIQICMIQNNSKTVVSEQPCVYLRFNWRVLPYNTVRQLIDLHIAAK